MPYPFAALELDRVLQVVALFARSELGKDALISALPSFKPGEGRDTFLLARDLQRHVDRHGTLALVGLDAAALLATPLATPEPEDLLRLVGLVRCIVESRSVLTATPDPQPILAGRAQSLPSVEGLLAFCEQRLSPDGSIPDSASSVLAQARRAQDRSRHRIIATLEQLRRQHRQLAAPFTVRRDRYCVPLPTTERGSLQGLVLDVSASGATLFLEPFEVVELNNALAEAQATAREEEEKVLLEVANGLTRQRDELMAAARTLTTIDAFQARVLFGKAVGAVLLEPGAGGHLYLAGARHPLLDPALADLRVEALAEEGNTKPVVPLDLELRPEAKVVLLSGPNAGGKTIALKTVGLAALMAQLGIPVLAEPTSTLPSFSGIWCHVGDEQDLFSELSTFTAAMRATASLLTQADGCTLVLYDELGSGTDPEEGAALATALLEELTARGSWSICTAHLVTVAAHVASVSGIVNACMGFDERAGRPTYRLEMGSPGRSHGLTIAEGCGVPPRVLQRARELLSRAFLALDTHLERLETERARLEGERAMLTRHMRDVEIARARAQEEHARLEADRKEARQRLMDDRDALRRQARERLRGALDELEQARQRGELPGKKRQAALRRAAMPPPPEEEEGPARAFAPGESVRLVGSKAEGTVKSVVGDRLELVLGSKRVWVSGSSCEPSPSAASTDSHPVVVSDGESTATELKLLGLDREEARQEVERFVDRALLAGARRVRIIHGHGSGALRRTVREVLAGHPAVVSFAHPPQSRGGTGATEADLE